MKKQFLILFAFISALALSQVPQRFNKVIVTGDITSPKFIKTGSNADSVLLGNGSARSVNSLKTDTVNLSNRINAKATGNGTANGTNTGDETLTSIKTKLGAATSVSDGYLKYQDFALLHTPTTVTASNGLSISGQNISLQNASLTQSGALTFNDWNTFNSKEPAITKNTGFNLPLGTTTGTVLEGRTFGTSASSAVGDFIQNQNSSAQSANMWIKGSLNTNTFFKAYTSNNIANAILSNSASIDTGSSTDFNTYVYGNNPYGIWTNGAKRFSIDGLGATTFSSTVNSTGFLLNGNNLTSSLTTNYIPKWNGSSFVNATAGTDYQLPITLTTNGTSGAATLSGNVLNVPNYASTGTGGEFTSNYTNISNTTLSTSTLATYTNINGIINASVFGAVTSTASGKCTFRVSVPTTIRSGRCAVISGVESGKTTSANIFIEGTGSTYVDISFIASTSSSILEFKMITMGY